MKRVFLFAMLGVLCVAQASRDIYREAYRAWRQADPNLERESVQGGAAIAQRADRMAAEAAKAAAARKAYLEAASQDESQQISSLSEPLPDQPAAALSGAFEAQFVTGETATVTRNIETFAGNPDAGLQQLRQALIRERAALEALSPTIAQRKKSADAAGASGEAIEAARDKVLAQSQTMRKGFEDVAEETTREGAAWVEYYRKIGEGAQGAATPITEVPAGVPLVTLNNPIPAPPTITPVPLARYLGAWTYPQTNGLHHGAQPEFLDMLVNEENGHVTGTMFGRFKLPPGTSGDPVLRFDFSGDLQSTRNQVFNLVTSDGTKGTVELIPGPAFNLLEVNFQTEQDPGKVRQADAVLVKK